MSPWATAPQNHRGEAGRHRLAAPARAEIFKPEKLKWMLRFSGGHWFPWASLGLVRQTDRSSSSPSTRSLKKSKTKAVCRWNMEKGCSLESTRATSLGAHGHQGSDIFPLATPKAFRAEVGTLGKQGRNGPAVPCHLLETLRVAPRVQLSAHPAAMPQPLPPMDTALPGPCPSPEATGGCTQCQKAHLQPDLPLDRSDSLLRQASDRSCYKYTRSSIKSPFIQMSGAGLELARLHGCAHEGL